MDGQQPVDLTSWPKELAHLVRQVQQETLHNAAIGLIVGGFTLMIYLTQTDAVLWTMGIAAGMLLLGAIVWQAQRYSYHLAAWLLVLGVSGAVGGMVIGLDFTWAVFLLAVPAGLATLTLTRLAGSAVATGLSVALWLWPALGNSLSAAEKTATLFAIWSVVGMVWLAFRPLISTLRWAWFGYETNYELLKESRAMQVRLLQTLGQLKEANIQLNRLNQLAQSLRLVAEEERRIKEQFVANVSHELRTPLNMIIGFSEMITQSPRAYSQSLPATLLADLKVVLRNSQHLSSLIDDVLDLSQIEAGQMTISRERTALGEIVEAAVIAVRPLFESKSLFLKTDIPYNLPSIWCDRTRIREVLLNLLTNAGRFTAVGGVTVRARQDGDFVEVSVADTGSGIAAEKQKLLFQPFQQLDTATKHRYGGTGLGLSISKRFIELHDGKIWVESQEGQGTIFTFRLPVDPAPAVDADALRWVNPYMPNEEREARAPLPAISIPPRVVVMEPGHTLQRLISRQWPNIEVTPVQTLAEAREALARTPANLLLVNDPGGCQDIASLKAQLPENIPVVFLNVAGSTNAASDLGVQDYLLKPIGRQELLDALNRLDVPIKCVLLVDDEPDALQLFSRILLSADKKYRVLRAMNGLQALEILNTEYPDVIMLDLTMPEMDGFGFLEVKNRQESLRGIPVILTSARDPVGGPVASQMLSVTTQRGLSLPVVMDCLAAVTAVFAKHGLSGAPITPGIPPA